MCSSDLSVKTLLQAGARVEQIFDRHGWQFCFIGGVANFRWGTPRLTNDLDLTLLTGFGAEERYDGTPGPPRDGPRRPIPD